MSFVAVGVGAAALGTAAVGAMNSSSQRDAAKQAQLTALNQYLAINVPDPKQQELILKQYQQTGQLDPAMEQAINQGASAQGSIALDPNTRNAQMSALGKLSDITSNNGMDAQERNQVQQITNATNTNEQGQRGAILQNAAARGVGGSGASLAAQLQAEQSGANNASSQAMNAQSQASQRALSALSQQGSLAGQVHSQDYNQALNAANATDAINQFNARNANSAMSANTQAQNQAQAANVAATQNIANQNTGLANYQQQYNSNLQEQNFQNRLALASGRANAENGVANQANIGANATANQWAGISGALGTAATSIYKNNSKQSSPGGNEGEDSTNGEEEGE